MSDRAKSYKNLEWRDIYGFPNYELSNEGDLRNKKTHYILKKIAHASFYGYEMVPGDGSKPRRFGVFALMKEVWPEVETGADP